MGSVFGTSPPYDVTFSRSDILVSDDVIDRVKSHQSHSPPAEAPPPAPIPLVKEEPPPTAVHDSAPVGSVAAHHLVHSLDQIERNYETRLRKVEERNDKFLKAAEEEFTKVVDRLQAKYIRGSPEECCVADQKAVEDCYKANGTKSLNCSKEVESFIRCVAAFRYFRMRKSDPETL
uniref:CHCH domain-containing protein n=1 Tax=Mesocestoides corti TaxID=53468 RepID=A0A5K3FM80_MESCO